MALFEKRAPASDAPLSAPEAFVGIAACAVYSDGFLDADEADALADELAGFAPLVSLSDEELRAAFERVDAHVRAHGEEALLLAACAAVPPRLRATAFYLGADLVLSDGDVGREEKAFVERLRTALGLSPELAVKIVEVIAIKNMS